MEWKNAPLPGPLFMMMVRLMTVRATTLQKRVGSVYSPTQFGMIHFKHQKSELATRERGSFSGSGPRDLAPGNRTRGEFATTSVQERRNHAAEAIEEIIQKVDEEMAFMGQRASSGHAREKRFLAAVIAAASAIFSFGLGHFNGVELKNLRETTNGLAKNQRFIVAQLVELARETDKELDLAVESDPLGLHPLQDQPKACQVRRSSPRGRSKMDARLVSPDGGTARPSNCFSARSDAAASTLVEEEARRVGMKVAPMENRMEILFSAPVTTYFEDDVIHVWVSVPLIPEEAPVFELLHLSHQPIPMDEYLVELDAGDGYLAVDHLRRVHALMSATELAACDVHRNHYFCRRGKTFSTETDNCPIALLRGEKPAAAKLCK
jgi:hypothetical protein